MDHMRRGTVDLSAVGLLALDEADQMLDMASWRRWNTSSRGANSHRAAGRIAIEPRATVAIPAPLGDGLTLWVAAQSPFRLRAPLARMCPPRESRLCSRPRCQPRSWSLRGDTGASLRLSG
jgi:hypothetical protein